ncbi:hypothetical protein DFJ63DRAFT_333685 [Scheffersomyces coipomensis]|uniref:uncharacterized protein n=1 Tax=Scheffersomyces coipomensis TaxID=1788519 RepID=UPI00315D8263
MSQLRELLNCNLAIQFYEKYEGSALNLLQISDYEEITKPYEEGLVALTQFLNNVDITTDLTLKNELEEMFALYLHFPTDNYKVILIMAYKFLNSHCISNDISEQELSEYSEYQSIIREIYMEDIRKVDPDLESGMRTLIVYGGFLKFHRNVWNLGEIEINPPKLELSSRSYENLWKTSRQGPYIARVDFVKRYGFFYPIVTNLNDRFFQTHIDLLSVKIDRIRSFQVPDDTSQPRTKIHLIIKFICYLNRVVPLFRFPHRIYCERKREFPLDILKNTMTDIDLVIDVKNRHVVPAVIVRNNLKFMFENFQKTKNSNLTSSSEFIGLYSEALLNSILTKSSLSFISDGRFCIAILFNVDKLDNEDNI